MKKVIEYMYMETDIEKVKDFFMENQRHPTHEEMKKLFEVKSKNTVAYRVNKMIKAGVLKKVGRHIMFPQWVKITF